MLTAAHVDARHAPGRCPLCGNVGHPRFTLAGYRIHRCGSCEAEFNAAFEGGGTEGQLFDSRYYRARHKEAFAAGFDDYGTDLSTPTYRRRLKQIEERTGIGTILDVGPGLGTFLRLARDAGWAAEGVEVSAFAADFIRRNHGLPVYTGDLTDFSARNDRAFDAIAFWDSIEHVGDPLEVLAAARRLLRPGGVLLIATDNFDCLVADLAVVCYRLSNGNVTYPVERVFIDRNRTYFTERTLRALLQRLQFEIVYLEKMEYPLGKIRTTLIERLILSGIYGLAHVLNRQAQITLLAIRP